MLVATRVPALWQCPRHPEWLHGLVPLASPELGDIWELRQTERVSVGTGTLARAMERPFMVTWPLCLRVLIGTGKQA